MKKLSTGKEAALIIGISVVLGLLTNAFSAKPLPLIPSQARNVAVSDESLFGAPVRGSDTPAPPPVKRSDAVKVIAPLHDQALKNPDSTAAAAASPRKEETTKIIFLAQFRRLMKDAHPLIIDGRESDAYAKGHVKGAHNAYGLEIEHYFERLAVLPKDTLVLVYCTNPECHLGRMVTEFMTAIGFTNIYLYDDGWDGWEKAGLPADTTDVPW